MGSAHRGPGVGALGGKAPSDGEQGMSEEDELNFPVLHLLIRKKVRDGCEQYAMNLFPGTTSIVNYLSLPASDLIFPYSAENSAPAIRIMAQI